MTCRHIHAGGSRGTQRRGTSRRWSSRILGKAKDAAGHRAANAISGSWQMSRLGAGYTGQSGWRGLPPAPLARRVAVRHDQAHSPGAARGAQRVGQRPRLRGQHPPRRRRRPGVRVSNGHGGRSGVRHGTGHSIRGHDGCRHLGHGRQAITASASDGSTPDATATLATSSAPTSTATATTTSFTTGTSYWTGYWVWTWNATTQAWYATWGWVWVRG